MMRASSFFVLAVAMACLVLPSPVQGAKRRGLFERMRQAVGLESTAEAEDRDLLLGDVLGGKKEDAWVEDREMIMLQKIMVGRWVGGLLRSFFPIPSFARHSPHSTHLQYNRTATCSRSLTR